MLFGVQIALGAVAEIHRLGRSERRRRIWFPTEILAVIRTLPPTARLAYSCGPRDEVSPWEPSLVSIEAHTSRRLVPMCFESDVLTVLNGGQESAAGNPAFAHARQRALYPTEDLRPIPPMWLNSSKENGIGYI